jgi:photosystem II stability/assembly factor-like uncharacterized protein
VHQPDNKILLYLFTVKTFKNMNTSLLKNLKKLSLLIVLIFVSYSSYSQWTPQALGVSTTGRDLMDIEAVDENIVWAVSRDNAGVAHVNDVVVTTNGGATWTTRAISIAPNTYDFSCITAVDENRAWAGMYNATGTGSAIYYTSNGGLNWVQQGAGAIFNSGTSFINVVHFFNSNIGFAMGDPSGGYFEIYTTTDGGNNWIRTPQANIPAPIAGEYGTTDKYFVMGNTIWFTTTFGRVFKSTDLGINWTVSTAGSVGINDIAFRDVNNGIVMVNNGTIQKTSDGGTTWTPLPTFGTHDAADMTIIPNTHVYVSCGMLGSFYSYDDGANWITLDNIPHPNSSAWLNAELGWASGINTGTSDGIYKYSGSFASPINGMTRQAIGYTNYQLQTNASISSNLINSPDGTLSATWNMSNLNDGAYSDRGTGYNYFNGTAWEPPPTNRVESVRTGFTNVVVTGTNKEIIISHEGTGLHSSVRAVKGTGAWLEASFNSLDLWPKVATGGPNNTTIHAVSMANGGSPFMGQANAIHYSRSLNSGTSWDISQQIISEINNVNYLGFNAENYTIDANGNTIAIVLGKLSTDVVLLKSTDNGDNWTKTIVKQFPIPLYDQTTMNTDLNADNFGDEIETNNGSFSVLVDDLGKVHVWYGKAVVIEQIGESALGYYGALGGIMYWNDNMAPDAPIQIADFIDFNTDGIPTFVETGSYVTNTSCNHPSSGIDGAGNLYLVYSALYDGNADGGNVAVGKSFRHSLITRSTDGGATWCTPLDITAPESSTGFYDYREGVFAAMAKRVDNNVHLLLQEDNSPGTGIGTTLDPQANNALSTIYYYKIPVNAFCTPVAIPIGANQITTPVSCQGANDGSSTLSAYGGASPYTYVWNTNPVVVGPTISNLPAGLYTCTITDSLNQTFEQTIIIDEPAPLSLTSNITGAVCGTITGAIALTTNGGNSSYSYAWSNGATTSTVSGIVAGTYSVIVTDSKGCTISSSYQVQQIPANFNVDFTANPQTGAAPLAVAFNNITPSIGSYNFTWSFGDGNNQSSNNGTVFNNYNFSGLYNVSLIAVNIATGCADTITKTGFIFITGAGCSHTATINPSTPLLACEGDSILLTANTNAVAPYSIVWNINGIVISAQNDDSLYVTESGYYSATIIKNGCPITSNATQLTFNTNPLVPQITSSGTIQSCNGGQVTLTASLISGVNYTWNNAATTQSILVNTAGTYFVTASYPTSGCSSVSNPFVLNNTTQTQDICLVTVDSLSTHNIVIWNKPISGAIDSFRVYRLIATNTYMYLASIAYEDSTIYHDYAANPNVTQWAYKVSVIDTCDAESSLSEYHYTMHLQLLGNGNMQWTHYEIENQPNPVSYYEIFRDDLDNGNWALLSGAIPGTNSTYTDVNYASYPDANYRIEIIWGQSCESTLRLLNNNNIQTTIVRSKSNIKNNRTVGVQDAISKDIKIKVYPNPANELLNVEVSLLNEKESTITVENMLGQVVYTTQTTKQLNQFNIATFASGVYFVKVKTKQSTCIEKLIIEQ